MLGLQHFLKGALLTLACALLVSAQTATTTPAELSVIIGENKVKFTPLRQYQELRLAVFNSVNELIYDSGALAEAELNWNLHDSNGQRLKPGLYAYTLSLKVPDAEAPRKHQGHFILEKGNDQIWLTTKGEGSVGAEVTGGQLTVARTPERTTAGAGYVASGRSLSERAGTQRDTQGRTIADRKNGVTREEGGSTLNISGSGTTNRLTKWLDGPNGVVGDSVIHETASGDLGIGTTSPGGVFDLQRNSASDILQRFWNTGTGGSKLRYVANNAATAQVQFTGLTRWWSAIAATKDSLQFRTLASDNPVNTEAELAASPRMTILQNGNIGIGVTAPAAKLDVAGDLRTSARREELTASSPNVINGFLGTFSAGNWTGNRVTAGVVGATIGGGGQSGGVNYVAASYGTVGGGLSNTASGSNATVGGGDNNFASGIGATVGGGESNTVISAYATVGGGEDNTASGSYATVPGGRLNTANGNYSFAAGRQAKAMHQGAFVWADSTVADFTSTANDQFLIRAAVGIGTNSPTKAKLQVEGFAYAAINSGYYLHPIFGAGATTPGTFMFGIYSTSAVAGEAFFAFSDERIKRIHGQSDAARDLATLAGIKVTDYSFIDTVAKGTGRQKKVIAQQVEEVFPQAVKRSTDVVPDIYQKAAAKNGWVTLATSLKQGERVRLISADQEGVYEVLEVEPSRFRTAFVAKGDEVFVYGREVKDFRSVDYEAISMLNVSATQELHRLMGQKDAEIKAIKAENEALAERLAALELMLQQFTQQTLKAQPKQQ